MAKSKHAFLKSKYGYWGIAPNDISLDVVLTLMDIYAMPYKACVLRLYECNVLSAAKARQHYGKDWKKTEN